MFVSSRGGGGWGGGGDSQAQRVATQTDRVLFSTRIVVHKEPEATPALLSDRSSG